jgi:hypothetical protein
MTGPLSGKLIEEAVHATFGARPVVTDDVEDQLVVELPNVLHGPGSAGRSPCRRTRRSRRILPSGGRVEGALQAKPVPLASPPLSGEM